MKQVKTLLVAALCSVFGLSAFAWPDNMYFVGGPFGGDWSLDSRSEAFEKDADDPTVFYYKGYIGYPTYNDGNTPGEFKIIDGPAWNGFHPAQATNYVLSKEDIGKALPMLASDEKLGDTKWVLPEDHSMDGWYEIKLTTAVGNRTFTIERFTPAQSDYTVGLFIYGGPFVNNSGSTDWLVYNNYARMERDQDNPNLFHYKGYIERSQWGGAPGDFRFALRHGWHEQLRPGEQSIALTSYPVGEPQTIFTTASGDTNWQLPEDGSANGYWDFTVDPKNLTFTVNEFIHDLDYFTEMYLVGNAVPAGWNAENPEVMQKSGRGVYTWTGVLAAPVADQAYDFKFLRRKSWSGGCYVANTENEAVSLGTSAAVKYEKNYTMHNSGNDYKFTLDPACAGKEVTVTLDLNAKTLLVTENVGTGVDAVEALQAQVFAAEGKVMVSGLEGEDYTASIFTLDGRQVAACSFNGRTEVALSQGCYVVTVRNEAGKAMKAKVAVL